MGSIPIGGSVSHCIVKIMVVFVIWNYDFFSRCDHPFMFSEVSFEFEFRLVKAWSPFICKYFCMSNLARRIFSVKFGVVMVIAGNQFRQTVLDSYRRVFDLHSVADQDDSFEIRTHTLSEWRLEPPP